MAWIAESGGPRGLILAEKSRIADIGQPAIVAAQAKFPPCTGLVKAGYDFIYRFCLQLAL